MLYRNLLIPCLIFVLMSAPVMAGNITVGYTSGPAKADDSSLFEDPAGYYLFIGNQTDYLLGFEFAILGMIENPVYSNTGLGGTSLTATATLPLGMVSLFVRAGMADWAVFENDVLIDDGTTATYGAGLGFHFNKNWALRLEQQRFTKIGPTETDIAHTRFGVVYTFD